MPPHPGAPLLSPHTHNPNFHSILLTFTQNYYNPLIKVQIWRGAPIQLFEIISPNLLIGCCQCNGRSFCVFSREKRLAETIPRRNNDLFSFGISFTGHKCCGALEKWLSRNDLLPSCNVNTNDAAVTKWEMFRTSSCLPLLQRVHAPHFLRYLLHKFYFKTSICSCHTGKSGKRSVSCVFCFKTQNPKSKSKSKSGL